jgi:ribosomal protein S18 acetylase RimI-like enzyme
MNLRPIPIEEKNSFWKLFQVYQGELAEHSGSRPGPDGDYPYIYYELYWRQGEPRFPFYIIEGEQVAGLVLLRHLTTDELHRSCRGLQIAEVYLLPRFRGTGLALAVIEEAVRRAQDQGRRLTWSCYQSNVRAVGLYDKALDIFKKRQGWLTEKEVFVDTTGQARYFYSIIPEKFSGTTS